LDANAKRKNSEVSESLGRVEKPVVLGGACRLLSYIAGVPQTEEHLIHKNERYVTMVTRVLIVDDSSTNLYVLESILKGYGFEVTSAENGKEALEKARSDPPDLIISDILMPVMDGYALCREWKSDDTLKWIPLVFYTGTYTTTKDEAFALSLGVDLFILKPQEPDILMSLLQEVLQEGYTARQVSVKPLGEEMEVFRQHNEILFHKLEKKMLDLEEANQELRISEERYRLSFENASDVIYTIDTNYNIASISPSVELILGYRPEDFIGKSVTVFGNILAPESLEKAVNNINNVLNGETIPPSTYEFITKDGERKYGEVSGSPIIRDGKVSGLICVARDITDRKQVEKELREAFLRRQEMEFIVNNSETLVWLWKVEQGWPVEYVSDNIRRYGYTPDDFTSGRISYASIIHPDDLQRIAAEIEQYTNEDRSEFAQEYRIISKSGDIHWADDRTSIRRGPDGSATHYQGVVIDITERKRAEEALQQSEEKYRDILDNIDDAYYELDLKGNIVFFNESMISKTGYSSEELMGMNYRQYISSETSEQVLKVFGEIYRTGKPHRNFTYEVIMKGGQKRHYESWANPLFDENNRVIGFRGMAHDITDRKEAEKQLQKTLETLRRAVGTTVQVMVSAVEIRDPYTAGHQLRVADLASSIAIEMGLPSEKIESIRMTGSIHDIGKLSVPAEILVKPGRLTEIEYSLIKEHPQRGYEMLKDVESSWPLAQIVHQHHERMDGSGYPQGLKGDEILMEARIMAVADVIEAMASHRPYRPTLGIDAALDEIVRYRGVLYDPEVVDACLRLFHEKGYTIV